MPRFSSTEKQATKSAENIGRQLNDFHSSVGTVRNYQQAIKAVALNEIREGRDVREMTVERAQHYLEARAEEVGQKTLDMERQALQSMMQNVTQTLPSDQKLDVVKSEHAQVLESRAYTPEQVSAVAEHQQIQNSLATEIAHAAGLRAHELLTLERTENRPPDERDALDSKFEGREGASYTVEGKGGLTREITIPESLAERLEERRLEMPREVTDRGIFYQQNYEINGGNAWSKSFSEASERALGWSEGAHGCRHSYAQERMEELEKAGYSREIALETVSQEMGHFRPEITEVYLR
jgi:integrase